MRKKTLLPRICVRCNSCRIACSVEHSVSKNLFESVLEEPKPVPRLNFKCIAATVVLESCVNCKNAACVDVCPVQAPFKDENGYIQINYEKCFHCGKCLKSCPENAIVNIRKKIFKCDGCTHLEKPACVAACPTGALKSEALNIA